MYIVRKKKDNLCSFIVVPDSTVHFFLFSLLLIRIVFRESSLLKADADEDVQQKSAKKKRKASETVGEKSVEHWVMKRQKLKAIRQEEALKNKRTLFVGNLPVSCTLKVSQTPSTFYASVDWITLPWL